MTVALPIGYVSILEAADMLLPAMYAGVDCRLIAIVPNGYPAGNDAVQQLARVVEDSGELSEFDENNTLCHRVEFMKCRGSWIFPLNACADIWRWRVILWRTLSVS